MTSSPVHSRSSRTLPASASRDRCRASAGVTTGSSATHSSTCRWSGVRVANTSLATRSTTGLPSVSRATAVTGSGAAATARAVSTTAAHQPRVRVAMAATTSAESVRACSATSAATSGTSRRSSSPRSTVKSPSSSGTKRVSGRSHRLRSTTRRLCGSRLSRSSRWARASGDSTWASSSTTSGGRDPPAAGEVSACIRSAPRPGVTLTHRASAARPLRCSHPATPRVFPAPTGATTRVTRPLGGDLQALPQPGARNVHAWQTRQPGPGCDRRRRRPRSPAEARRAARTTPPRLTSTTRRRCRRKPGATVTVSAPR